MKIGLMVDMLIGRIDDRVTLYRVFASRKVKAINVLSTGFSAQESTSEGVYGGFN